MRARPQSSTRSSPRRSLPTSCLRTTRHSPSATSTRRRLSTSWSSLRCESKVFSCKVAMRPRCLIPVIDSLPAGVSSRRRRQLPTPARYVPLATRRRYESDAASCVKLLLCALLLQHRDGLVGLSRANEGHTEVLGHLLLVASQVRCLSEFTSGIW